MSTDGHYPLLTATDDFASIRSGHTGTSNGPLSGQGATTTDNISPIPNPTFAIRKLQIDIGHLQDVVDNHGELLRTIISELGGSDDSEDEEHTEPHSPMEYTSNNQRDSEKQPFKKWKRTKYGEYNSKDKSTPKWTRKQH